MIQNYPSISCVVIGLNCERTIADCLESIKDSSYSNMTEIIYVDGGSKDRSVEIAKLTKGVQVVELKLEHPTPGKGRNAGWRKVEGEWVHFFDSDVVVYRNWILEAVKHIDEKTGAVFGWRKEIHPRKNWLHFIADFEWAKPIRDAKFFGGDVLIRRQILEETGGYNESLIAGEDPELSVRIRNNEWKIRGVNSLTCYHDINMDSMRQYFRRSFRSGYGYADAGIKMLKAKEIAWVLKTVKICIKAVLVLFLATFSLFAKSCIGGLLTLILFFSPMIKIFYFQKKFNIRLSRALLYAIHCSIILWPQFFGVTNYFFKQIIKKLNFS